ncbi:GGDEF domain-containing protein [Actinoplanes sp. NPDC023714]|uniref:GGDEF domain-containing protein n=1 Tax=Actinoplanes sp. NPDC023714 TaxID=3154322 RepID=UPI00340D6B2D
MRPGAILARTPRRELVAWSVLVALLLADTVLYVLADLGTAFGGGALATAVNNTFYLLPGLMVATRARSRIAWLALAAGMLAYAAGNLYWNLHVADLDPEPLVTPADALWLGFYPCFAVALVLLLRARLPRVSAPALFDGVIAAAAVSALVSLPVLEAVDPAPGATALGVIVNAAYPLSDIAVAGCLLGAWALCGWRADRVLILLIAGMGLFATADAISMVLLWQGADVPSSLGLMWTLGMTLLTLAAYQPESAGPVTGRRPSMLVSTAIPAALAFLCLTLMAYAAFTTRTVAPVSSTLAVVAVAAAIVRMMLSVRGAEALGAARRQARTDELTGLANRRHFVEHLDELLAGRGGGELAVAFVDLDRFKEVNDSFGHDVGDSLLRMVGRRLHESIEPPVMLARLGGDEFGLVMPGMGTTGAAAVVDAVLRTLRAPFALREVDLHVDASIGIAICPADGDDRSTLRTRSAGWSTRTPSSPRRRAPG